MKIAIIYSTSSGNNKKKAAKILSNKIKAKIQLIQLKSQNSLFVKI